MEWPRVSDILRVLDHHYDAVPSAVLAAAAERGERLHRLCLSYLGSVGDMCAEPTDISPQDAYAYLSFRDWVRVNRVTPIAIEQESQCTAHQYKGTPDAMVFLGLRGESALIDLKFTASILRINRVQIMAYMKLDLYKDATHRLIIHVRPKDGHRKQETVKYNPRDFAAFLNALSVWRWRQS